MRTDEELYTVAHEACSLDEHPPDVSCGAHRRRAVYDLGRADERARLAGEGPTDAEFLSIADQISARWVKEHPRGATHNDRPLDKLIVRAIADLAAAHMAARFEARVAELEAAARALLEALPRCEADGCDRLATGEHTQDYHPVGTYYCDEHSRYRNVRDLSWCEAAAALERLVTK